jgi:hypothetical protein
MIQRRIEVHPEGRRVELGYQGPVTFHDRIGTLDVLAPLVIEGELTRVLIDYTQAWVNSPSVEVFERLEARMRSESSMSWLRIALVNPPDIHAAPTEGIATTIGSRCATSKAALARSPGSVAVMMPLNTDGPHQGPLSNDRFEPK